MPRSPGIRLCDRWSRRHPADERPTDGRRARARPARRARTADQHPRSTGSPAPARRRVVSRSTIPLGGLSHLFPAAATVAELDPTTLAMPGGRVARSWLRDARRRQARSQCRRRLGSCSNDSPRFPACGPWDALDHPANARAGDPDAFLPTDLGVRLGRRDPRSTALSCSRSPSEPDGGGRGAPMRSSTSGARAITRSTTFDNGRVAVGAMSQQERPVRHPASRPPAVEIEPGTLRIPSWLDDREQIHLLAACREWAKPPAGMRRPHMVDGPPFNTMSVCLGWHWYPYRYSRTCDGHDGAPVKPFPPTLTDLGAERARTPGSRRPRRRRDHQLLPPGANSASTVTGPRATTSSGAAPPSSRSASATRARSASATVGPRPAPTTTCSWRAATCSSSEGGPAAPTALCREPSGPRPHS